METVFLSVLLLSFKINGRGDRIRTCDPMVPNHVRYQTALHPVEPLPAVFADDFYNILYVKSFVNGFFAFFLFYFENFQIA